MTLQSANTALDNGAAASIRPWRSAGPSGDGESRTDVDLEVTSRQTKANIELGTRLPARAASRHYVVFTHGTDSGEFRATFPRDVVQASTSLGVVNGTASSRRVAQAVVALRSAVRASAEVDLEDGVASPISRCLMRLAATLPFSEAARAILRLVQDDRIGSESGSEMLKWLPRADGLWDARDVRRFLESLLRNDRMVIRDGALLGLGTLDDPASIKVVQEARDSEPIAWLKDEMNSLLGQLEETSRCHSS